MLIRTVTVLGANGSMGSNVAAIFASFGNCRVFLVSRKLEDSLLAKQRALQSVKAESVGINLIPKTYDDLHECIPISDLIFESVAENLTIKKSVYRQIIPFLKKGTIIGTGSSGLSINELCEDFPLEFKENYIGIHMFNPPYSLSLCELIPSSKTSAEVTNYLDSYLSNILLRDVVITKDKPAFLANRIGFQFINECLQLAEKYSIKGGISFIDYLIGGYTGRSMPPLVTADFVGLDVHKAIVDNVYYNSNDPIRDTFIIPKFALNLIEEGKLGIKSKEGLYRVCTDDFGENERQVYNISKQIYERIPVYSIDFIEEVKNELKNGNYKKAVKLMFSNDSTEGKLVSSLLLSYVLYSLELSLSLCNDIHAADHAMGTGFGWIPPLSLIDALGGIDEFSILVDKNSLYLANILPLDVIYSKVENSKYDYRKFLKARG